MRRLAVARVSLWIALGLSFVLAATLAGCRCGGTGDGCNENSDCQPGDYCDPITLTCVTIDSGPPPDSGGPGPDSGGPGDAGTDAASCPDADGDGVTTCAGDCDDTDPLTYPGAPEVCGDLVTNDCDSTMPPDTGCGGIGTYVAPPPLGSPANPGTQAAPVDTINQGIMNAMTIGGGVDVYVAADTAGPGMYAEDIVMVDGISLYGGYESAGWTRDSAVNITVITSTVAPGVTFGGAIGRATELDGFTVNGAGGNGGSGAAITIYDGSEPTVSGNVINGPGTGGASYAIDINPGGGVNTASPLIAGNIITIGSSAGGWGGGTGGYGIATRSTPSEIRRNSITFAPDDTIQRGIEAAPGAVGLVIANNVVMPPSGGSSDVAFGIRVGGGAGTIDSNSVAIGSCFTFCTGISLGGSITATVTNNVAFGGMAPTSYGLSIEYEGVPASTPDILVHSNFFDGAGLGATTGGSATLSAGVNLGENPAAPVVAGRFYDNILYSGIGTVRYAMRENHFNIDPEFLDSNALYVETSPPAIVSALYLDEGLTGLTTPAMVDGAGASAGLYNIEDSCGVLSPVPGGDYHIPAGSACIDAGNAAELPAYDFEGDVRPAGAGPDIGVDET